MLSRELLVCFNLGIQHRHCHFSSQLPLSTIGPVLHISHWQLWAFQCPRVLSSTAYHDKLREELDQMIRDNVIAQQPCPLVCTHCNHTEKGQRWHQICVDLYKLYKYIKHERYLSPSPHEAVADITSSDATYFTTIDALSGYWEVPLAPWMPFTNYIYHTLWPVYVLPQSSAKFMTFKNKQIFMNFDSPCMAYVTTVMLSPILHCVHYHICKLPTRLQFAMNRLAIIWDVWSNM